MSIYNIFWIDDKHEEMQGFKDNAFVNGIKLHAFADLETGMKELEENFEKYDGVLLDVKFKENDKSTDSPSSASAMRATVRISNLKKKFKIVYYSGEEETFAHDATKTFLEHEGVVFSKHEDPEPLFKKLIEFADKQDENQIKLKYPEAFEACSKKFLGESSKKSLMKFLKNKEYKDLTELRKIVEALFEYLAINKYIPEEITKMNHRSKFLCGNIVEGYYLNEKNPLPISNSLEIIVRSVQVASHHISEEDLKKDLDKYYRDQYSKQGLFYLLVDVLIYFKKEFFDKEKKAENWSKENESDFTDGYIMNLFQNHGFVKFHKSIFFHKSNCKTKFDTLCANDRIKFKISKDMNGRDIATDVTKIS
tara:strand:+ start:105 stop:1199 length:1095 start_codon:yes stop_codon:yes gene_type:complete